jgi:hypothetical protein
LTGAAGRPQRPAGLVASASEGERGASPSRCWRRPHAAGPGAGRARADRGGKARHLCLHTGLQRPTAQVAPVGLRRLCARALPGNAGRRGAQRDEWRARPAWHRPEPACAQASDAQWSSAGPWDLLNSRSVSAMARR